MCVSGVMDSMAEYQRPKLSTIKVGTFEVWGLQKDE
jgi:hypothetical protein